MKKKKPPRREKQIKHLHAACNHYLKAPVAVEQWLALRNAQVQNVMDSNPIADLWNCSALTKVLSWSACRLCCSPHTEKT